MAHDKAFLVCENKCFVEGMSKEEIERRSSYLSNEAVVVGKFNNSEIKRHMIWCNILNVNVSESTYSLTLDYFNVLNVINAYVIVEKTSYDSKGNALIKFEKLNCKITNDVKNQSLIISCNLSDTSDTDAPPSFIFVFEEF